MLLFIFIELGFVVLVAFAAPKCRAEIVSPAPYLILLEKHETSFLYLFVLFFPPFFSHEDRAQRDI